MLTNNRRAAHDPALDERVVSLLAAAAAPTEPGAVPGEVQAVAAFRAASHTTRRPSMYSSNFNAKTFMATSLGAGLLLTGGVSAAAAGTLPGAAQDTASEWLAKVGVSVPGANAHSAGHADQRGASETADASTPAAGTDDGTTSPSNKGSAISELARQSQALGVDKGAEISTLASGGKSQAGVHGKPDPASEPGSRAHSPAQKPTKPSHPAGSSHGKSDGQPPVETPNRGGASTSHPANDHATNGTDTADEASSGHSSAGSSKRP